MSFTDMSYMFSYARYFNKTLNWDVSNFTNMSSIFNGAQSFNQETIFGCLRMEHFK